jgi:zinc protease
LRLAMQIFGGSGGGSGRLWDRIREKEGLSYGVGASISGGQYSPNADFAFYAITAPQNIDRVKSAFDDELTRARRDGFTADELKRAKEAVASASRLGRAQDASLGRTLMSFVERGKTPKYFAELDALRAQMSLDDVNAAFRKYIVPEKLVFGVAGDFANAKGAPAKLPAAAK